jgi:outer membrane protein OmpA-like peptidoglycan-associated protein
MSVTRPVLLSLLAGATLSLSASPALAAPPAPTILSGPQGATTQRSATFAFAGQPGASFECNLDADRFSFDDEFVPCTSPDVYSNLSLGGYTFSVRQKAGGETGPAATRAFTVVAADPVPAPPVVIAPPTVQPPAPDASRLDVTVAPTLTLRSNRMTVGCKLDAGALASCSVGVYAGTKRLGSAPKTFAGVASGQVTVKLSTSAMRLVRRPGGVRVTVRGEATTATGKALTANAGVVLLPRTATASLPAAKLFKGRSTRVSAAGKRQLTKTARTLQYAKKVRCDGHTDKSGSARADRALALKRAKAVCAALRKAGVRASLSSRTYGSSRAKAGKSRAANRRVELQIRYA